MRAPVSTPSLLREARSASRCGSGARRAAQLVLELAEAAPPLDAAWERQLAALRRASPSVAEAAAQRELHPSASRPGLAGIAAKLRALVALLDAGAVEQAEHAVESARVGNLRMRSALKEHAEKTGSEPDLRDRFGERAARERLLLLDEETVAEVRLALQDLEAGEAQPAGLLRGLRDRHRERLQERRAERVSAEMRIEEEALEL